ncbi:MAG: hypothetical protein HZA84_01200 [Thaumarchaeota archaeon]|nr:hypothetical protein [Nitrososphaerota archaeon]
MGSNKFQVQVDGVNLSTKDLKSLEAEIQQVVVRAIAKVDFKGDLGIKKLRPGTYGIWIGDSKIVLGKTPR